jgi:hypothetical protein
VGTSRVWFPVNIFNRHVFRGFRGSNIYLIFSVFAFIYFLSSFIHIWEREECSWFLNAKGWKYTNILQQWSFTYCQIMIRCAWYAAKLTTSREVSYNSINQATFPAEIRAAKCECSEQTLVNVRGVANFCVFVALTTSTTRNPANLSL